MRAEVTLMLHDDTGHTHRIVMRSKIFTLGRSSENDVVIDDPDISRRHAVIENYGRSVQITDCGSQNGTYLNGEFITGAVELQDGDRITLGEVYDLDVVIRQDAVRTGSYRGSDSHARRERTPANAKGARGGSSGASQAASSFPAWGTPVLIAVAAIVLILLVAGLILTLSRLTSTASVTDPNANSSASPNPTNTFGSTANAGTPPTNTGNSSTPNANGSASPQTTRGAANADQIESLARNVLRRLADDDTSIPENGVRDITRRVGELSSSASVGEKLSAMARAAPEISRRANASSFRPALMGYMVLAEMETTRNSNPIGVADTMREELNLLFESIDTTTVNSSLLFVAAYKYPPFRPAPGSRANHPLIASAGALGRTERGSASQLRSIWFLKEQNRVNANAYEFVLTFLAVGVISQRPADFGINTSPLIF